MTPLHEQLQFVAATAHGLTGTPGSIVIGIYKEV